jgi:hypothetical protein
MDRHACRQTDKQTDKETDRPIDKYQYLIEAQNLH